MTEAMQSEPLFTIGKIVAPHGVRGDVRVVPLTDFPERFGVLKKAFLDSGAEVQVTGVKYHKQFVLLKFAGLDDMNAVEPLRGKLLQVRQADLVKLPEGHYYHHQIIGLDVYEEDGGCLGRITDILETGSNDVYVTEQEGQKPILIPALKEVVRCIDIKGRRMIVKLQEWEDE